MKLTSVGFVNQENKLCLRLDAENQEESSLLVEASRRLLKQTEAFGRVDKAGTWLWIKIPVKREGYKDTEIGNFSKS